ncbi:ABC transporter permease [Saccharophagus degradans]|uniref:Binding-protein-dependent transport systems inner membrane component n=1 Tax=Saccharophagus degradans (strain 2-40 / ATCC 43961 / DSM 17024) TaxID=203122 RepID=Q21IF4_SACD2|nr:ABC transporter permease [Saccharophagus degradans]ABD81525.1 binding-protein-dependent transport systems inner membrane component [Saccharophagus degradans 2-40]
MNKVINFLQLSGLTWFVPMVRIAAGENPKTQAKELWMVMGIPIVAFVIFLLLWGQLSSKVVTSLGTVPGPSQVYTQAVALWDDHKAQREKAAAFYERQEKRNAKLVEAGKQDRVKWRDYTGAPTYLDQIVTSIKTVFMGFLLATIVAVPLGIFCGLSPTVSSAFNPIIQLFKPVSPLAWLPIVTMIVSATYVTSDDSWFTKSFLNSAITVTLCSLWPTLINTALGVASIDKDLMNVGKVLQLGWFTKITKLVLPSSLPLIFTGLRLSLGVGWMVLIAAEMLSQNPGLGKFVWDEFQNGSSNSLSKIMVAVLTIGVIGFLLDRVMFTLQNLFTFGEKR